MTTEGKKIVSNKEFNVWLFFTIFLQQVLYIFFPIHEDKDCKYPKSQSQG